MDHKKQWTLAWLIANRELREGISGFWIFIACIIIGVASIAGVKTISASFTAGLNTQAKNILGGDIDLRLNNQRASTEQNSYLKSNSSAISKTVEMRAMTKPLKNKISSQKKRSLIELKGVDGNYPLVGHVRLSPPQSLSSALSQESDEVFGAVADPNLLRRLGINVGEKIKIGDAIFKINATIIQEPDRAANVLNFGPRLLTTISAVDASDLIQPGSQIHFHTRLLLPSKISIKKWIINLDQKFKNAGWRVRSPSEAAPGTRRFIESLALFLNFIGLTALLVGGIGVGNAIDQYLEGKIQTIATFKCLGASGAIIFKIYLIQILLFGCLGISLGLLLGGGMPAIGLWLISEHLPITPEIKFYPKPLMIAATFGLLTIITFAIWPMGRAIKIPAASLFRDRVKKSKFKPSRNILITLVISVAIIACLIILNSSDKFFACMFILVALLIFTLLRTSALLLIMWATRKKPIKNASLLLAITNICRPDSNVKSIILSLGVGLSVLIAVTLIEANLNIQVKERLPNKAPAFFFIDIQPNQTQDFDRIVEEVTGAKKFKRMPSLRGRITEINGMPVEEVKISKESQWAINGDRALTSSANKSSDAKIIAGKWWPKNYIGPPLISLDYGLAEGFGVSVGDTLTLNVLGREIVGKISSLREIDWRSLKFDFAIIFSPGTFEGAPHTHIASVEAPPETEEDLEHAVTIRFQNITSIRVREALKAASNLLKSVSNAVGGSSLITILSGILVLAGVITSGQQRRIYESVIFKVFGVKRRLLVKSYTYEYGIIGLATGIISGAIGTLVAWATIVYLMHMEWVFLPEVLAVTLLTCLFFTISVGYLSTWRALGQKANKYLRNE